MNNLELIQPITTVEDLLESEAVENARKLKEFSMYEYNGIQVPRVTSIIDSMMSKEFLVQYAISFNSKYAYYNERDFILACGSKVHDMIEHFLKTGEDLDINFKKSPKQAPVIDKAYQNFKDWYIHLINTGNTFELIGVEIPVVNPYYGGCIDCIAKINNAYYILDFKTSKRIYYDYLLQTCAYLWTVNSGFCPELPHIDGIGIIRVDKEKYIHEDLFLNLFIPEQANIINTYIQGFGSLLSGYYQKINMEYIFNKYKRKDYPGLLGVIK